MPLPCDDGSAGCPIGLSWHPMRRTPYIHSVSVFADRRLGTTKRLGDGPRLLAWVDHPQNILSLPAEGWSVYGQFVLLLIEGLHVLGRENKAHESSAIPWTGPGYTYTQWRWGQRHHLELMGRSLHRYLLRQSREQIAAQVGWYCGAAGMGTEYKRIKIPGVCCRIVKVCQHVRSTVPSTCRKHE